MPSRILLAFVVALATTACSGPSTHVANPGGHRVFVDGRALVKLWEAGEVPFGREGLPVVDSPDHRALVKELDALAAEVDAGRDALVAESVFQLVQGRPASAAADLDAIADGEMAPPELESMRTPRKGSAATHRVLALFDPADESTSW